VKGGTRASGESMSLIKINEIQNPLNKTQE